MYEKLSIIQRGVQYMVQFLNELNSLGICSEKEESYPDWKNQMGFHKEVM